MDGAQGSELGEPGLGLFANRGTKGLSFASMLTECMGGSHDRLLDLFLEAYRKIH
jgi:hypothetical protein